MQPDHEIEYTARTGADFLRPGERIAHVERYGSGIIHDTFLVESADRQKKIILQRINTRVFDNPEIVMQNIRLVCDHVYKRLAQLKDAKYALWQIPEIIKTSDGQDYLIDEQGSFWRAFSFIENGMVLENVRSPEEAREVGIGLGRFHFLAHDLEPGQLQDTLPGFHEISHYLNHFDKVSGKAGRLDQPDRLQYCFDFIRNRRDWAPVLENALANGLLQYRVTHGDPKSNNVMLDRETHQVVSMIDLDTVKPGLILYDIADCLRSCCNTLDESAAAADVGFDANLCRSFLSGYLAEYPLLSDADYEYFFAAMRLIAFELGLRFVSDFLESDVYFKTTYKGQNLDRALVQFKLAESIESQESRLTGMITDCRDALHKC